MTGCQEVKSTATPGHVFRRLLRRQKQPDQAQQQRGRLAWAGGHTSSLPLSRNFSPRRVMPRPMTLSGPTCHVQSASVEGLSWREAVRDSPKPARGAQEAASVAESWSLNRLVLWTETNVFSPAPGIVHTFPRLAPCTACLLQAVEEDELLLANAC